MSLLPSAADCASSPSTPEFRSGGAQPPARSRAVAERLDQFPLRKNDRTVAQTAHLQVLLVTGMADSTTGHSSWDFRVRRRETAFAHIGDDDSDAVRPNAVARAGFAAEVDTKSMGAREPGRGHPANLGRGAGRRNGHSTSTGSCWRSGAALDQNSRRLEWRPFGEILSA